MFFICGINSGQKELKFNQLVICDQCGSYGRYQVFMTYMCLSLFFIPVLKWGKRYYVKMSCCGSVYELDSDTGKRIARGEALEIMATNLTLVQRGNRQNDWQYSQERSQQGGGWQSQEGNQQSGGWQSQRQEPGTIKQCKSCGYQTTEDFEYCPKCGTKF